MILIINRHTQKVDIVATNPFISNEIEEATRVLTKRLNETVDGGKVAKVGDFVILSDNHPDQFTWVDMRISVTTNVAPSLSYYEGSIPLAALWPKK